MANTPSVRFCKFLSSSGQRNHLHGYAVGRCGFSEMAVSEDTGNAPVSVATLTYAPVLERIRQVPRVENAALVTSAPLQGMNIGTGFTVVGQAKDPANKAEANVTAVSGVYARTPGTPIVRGRMVGDGDTSTTPFVIAINETLANKYFAGKDPLGKQMNLGGKDTACSSLTRLWGFSATGWIAGSGVTHIQQPLFRNSRFLLVCSFTRRI